MDVLNSFQVEGDQWSLNIDLTLTTRLLYFSTVRTYLAIQIEDGVRILIPATVRS